MTELMSEAGLLLRRDAIARGYTDDHLYRQVRAGRLMRIRHGAYASPDSWSAMQPREQLLLLVEAISKQYAGDLAFSHDSAVMLHQGPDHGLDTHRVHVTHFDRQAGRVAAGVKHHRGSLRVLDVTRVDEGWCTSPAKTILDITLSRGLRAGFVVAEDFLHRGLTSSAELQMLYPQVKLWPGALVVRLVIDLATGGSESVGEALGFLLFRELGLPKPLQQFEVHDCDGKLIGRTDWAWPEYGVLGEFDGKGKYLRHRRLGESIADCVMREKRREDDLREATGYRMLRLDWSALTRKEETGRRVRKMLNLPTRG